MGRWRLVVVIGDGRPSPLRPWLVGSLGVHLAAGLMISAWPGWHRSPVLPPDAVVVELIGGLPGTSTPPARGGAAATPPPEVPQEPDEGVTVSEPAPAPPKRLPEPKKPEPKPKPKTKKPQPPPPTPTEGEGEGTGPGETAGESTGSPSSGGSVSAMTGGGSAFGWYRASVTNALYLRWQRPVLTDLREPLEVQVDFDILRNGEVRDVRIAISSGVPSLDRSALRAVADASPLPPLPPAWRSDVLPASFVFRLYPEGS